MMKLAAHITFFYDEKRINYLKKTIWGLKAIGADILVHTNNRSLHNFIEDAQCIYYDLDGIHPFMLTRLSRPIMEKQFKSALYDYYMYIEDDIAFGPENFKYYLKYHEIAKAVKSFIEFLWIEYDESGKMFLTDLTHRLDKKLVLSGKEFIDCSNERYQAMWLLDAEEMGNLFRCTIYSLLRLVIMAEE